MQGSDLDTFYLFFAPKSLSALLIFLCTVILIDTYSQSSRRLPLPPGPRGYPFIGLTNIPFKKPWHTYVEWGKIYGIECFISRRHRSILT